MSTATPMATNLPGDELFVGQVIALLPLVPMDTDDPVGDNADLRAALAGADEKTVSTTKRRRARTYSVITYAPQRGIFMLGGREIDVSIHPLDVDTPLGAAVFRIASISGRSLRVTRTIAEPHPPKSAASA